MSGQENYELDIEINSRDIDETEKKLSRLDKLLQQTQKRFDALGKTRINPKITLDDRLTPAVTRIRDNLFRLDRTIVKPIASLIDHVSADVGVIRSSLASLTQTPWKISVVGPSWDTVIGQSFDDWMGTEGQSTLQRISSSLGNTLGDGLRGFIMKALGLVESPKIDESSNGILNGNQNIAEDQSIFGEAGRQAGERFFKSFLEEINSEEITNKITGVGSNSAGNGDKSCKDQDSEDSTTKDLMIGIAGGLITELIIKAFSKKAKIPSLPETSGIIDSIPSRIATYGTRASRLSKFFKVAGPIGTIALFDWLDKFNYESGDWIFGHSKGMPYSEPGIFKNPFKMNTYEDDRPGVVKRTIDYWKNKKEEKGTYYVNLNSPFNKFPEVFKPYDVEWDQSKKFMEFQNEMFRRKYSNIGQKTIEEPINLPEPQISKLENQNDSFQHESSINITFSPDSVNVIVQQVDIDYEEIATTTGWKIADAVKNSMQNLK